MDRSTTFQDAEGYFGPTAVPAGEPAASPIRKDGPRSNPPRRVGRPPRRDQDAAWSCLDCAGADAVAETFETEISLEPLGVAVVGTDGVARRPWVRVAMDCATGVVLDATLDFRP